MCAGAFFNYEISPLQVIHAETRQSFAHFVTSCVPIIQRSVSPSELNYSRTCAIVGGVLTVASLLDGILFATSRALKKAGGGGSAAGYSGGKIM